MEKGTVCPLGIASPLHNPGEFISRCCAKGFQYPVGRTEAFAIEKRAARIPADDPSGKLGACTQ